jgi:hypothetical protein
VADRILLCMKTMIEAIYIYKDLRNPGEYKIGKAGRERETKGEVVLERIKEQITAAVHGSFQIIKSIDVTSTGRTSLEIEGIVHKNLELRYNKSHREIRGEEGELLMYTDRTEWFIIPDKEDFEVIDMVQSIIKNSTGIQVKPEYIPRFYQEYIAVEMLDSIDKLIDKDQKEIKIGLELCPRFGKTVFALGSVFKTMFDAGLCKVLVLPSHWLSSHTSFEKEAKRYSDFDSFVYIKRGDQDSERIVKENLGKNPIVIEVSLYKDETDLNKISYIREIPKEDKLSIIDEADFGAHTEKSRDVISYIDSKYEIYMTGTNIQRALCGIIPDLILQFSYEEMLLIKKGIHPIQDKLAA